MLTEKEIASDSGLSKRNYRHGSLQRCKEIIFKHCFKHKLCLLKMVSYSFSLETVSLQEQNSDQSGG
jgi:hypothetical protein